MAEHADPTTGELTPYPDEELGCDPATTADDHIDDNDDNNNDDNAAGAERLSRLAIFGEVRLAATVGVLLLLAVTGLTGWLGVSAYQVHRDREGRALFLQIARQGVLNLTTIDYKEADADINRILDSATGQFYDDFKSRSAPFVDVVKKAQSKSEGTVTEAGLESRNGDQAQALVAVTVNTSAAGVPQGDPRLWRMRVSLQKVGDTAKVSNVEFVP